VDDDPQPRVDVPLVEALDGRAGEIFAPPFGAGSGSRMAWYYPVSFQKKLIVALDRMGEYDNYFYHCDYVSDPQTRGTGTHQRLPEREHALAQLGAVFHPAGTQAPLGEPLDIELAAGATRTLELAGPATLHEFQVRVRGTTPRSRESRCRCAGTVRSNRRSTPRSPICSVAASRPNAPAWH
jgi:hypothetical protein